MEWFCCCGCVFFVVLECVDMEIWDYCRVIGWVNGRYWVKSVNLCEVFDLLMRLKVWICSLLFLKGLFFFCIFLNCWIRGRCLRCVIFLRRFCFFVLLWCCVIVIVLVRLFGLVKSVWSFFVGLVGLFGECCVRINWVLFL